MKVLDDIALFIGQLAIGTVGAFITLLVLEFARRWWRNRRSRLHRNITDRALRKHLKNATDEQLNRDQAHYSLQRTQHTPKFAAEDCPLCGTVAPACCRFYREADRFLFGIRTELRLRYEQRRREARESDPAQNECEG